MEARRSDIFCFICMAVMLANSLQACIFPDDLQRQTWYTNIRAASNTAIYFRGGVMDYEDRQTSVGYITREYQHVCVQVVELNTIIVKYENNTYGCMKFVRRSLSVMQISASRVSSNYSASMCEEWNLIPSPWLLVFYQKFDKEYNTCPFSGGFNMKIKDSSGMDLACNLIDLPMRLESECLTGEAITFDFRSRHCIGSLPMSVLQKALCVSHWRSDGDVITVLRDPDNNKAWCLRIPARKSSSGKVLMILFTDLACDVSTDAQFYTLELELVTQNTLCTDEHNNCHNLPCTKDFESQCLRTCGMCDPNVYPTSCDFPRKFRDNWIINDNSGSTIMNISTSRLYTDKIGSFSCINFDDSPPRRSKQFTTLSFFNNGCRPRYTCISFKQLNSNSLGMSMSQSLVWPLRHGHQGVGATLCHAANFYGDPPPIHNAYRSLSDVFKPIISSTKSLKPKPCAMKSSYLFNGTYSNVTNCQGSFYKLCERPYTMRVEFNNCVIPNSAIDFTCLGSIDSKYWEHIMLLQNTVDRRDTRCLISSEVEPSRMIMLPAGECDKYTWTHVDGGIRQPLLDVQIKQLSNTCRSSTRQAINTSTTVSTGQYVPKPLNDAWRTVFNTNAEASVSNMSANDLETHKHRHHQVHTATTPRTVFRNDDVQPENSDNVAATASSLWAHLHFMFVCVLCL